VKQTLSCRLHGQHGVRATRIWRNRLKYVSSFTTILAEILWSFIWKTFFQHFWKKSQIVVNELEPDANPGEGNDNFLLIGATDGWWQITSSNDYSHCTVRFPLLHHKRKHQVFVTQKHRKEKQIKNVPGSCGVTIWVGAKALYATAMTKQYALWRTKSTIETGCEEQ